MIDCYAFDSVPPFAQGLVRDLRVRWALEEAGMPYCVTLVGGGAGAMPPSGYRAIQPFGQVPAIEDADLTLFESGAIVPYIAERSGSLLPDDVPARAHAIQWMFAALNTIEVPIQKLAEIDLFHPDESWAPRNAARLRSRRCGGGSTSSPHASTGANISSERSPRPTFS